MLKHISAALLAVLAAIPSRILGGAAAARPQASTSVSPEIRISGDLSFREIALELRDGTTVRGRLSGATAASIQVQQSGQERDYALPANGVPGGSQGLSNGSLGFVIGYHF
jgi:hypothetical protein